MAEVVKEIGNQVSRGVIYSSQNIKAPNAIYWGIIPGGITILIIYIIIAIIQPKVTGTSTIKVCNGNNRSCRDKKYSNQWKLLLIIFIPIIIGLIVGSSIYKLGIYVLNPKIGLGIETTRLIRGALK